MQRISFKSVVTNAERSYESAFSWPQPSALLAEPWRPISTPPFGNVINCKRCVWLAFFDKKKRPSVLFLHYLKLSSWLNYLLLCFLTTCCSVSWLKTCCSVSWLNTCCSVSRLNTCCSVSWLHTFVSKTPCYFFLIFVLFLYYLLFCFFTIYCSIS